MMLRTEILMVAACGFVFGQAPMEEIVPGFLVGERFVLESGTVECGMQKAEAVKELGDGWKSSSKPKRYTTPELLGQMRLFTSMYPAETKFNEWSEKVALQCGTCWMEILEKKFGKKDTMRVTLMGPSQDSMKVAMVIFDRDRAMMKHLAWQSMRDSAENARYVVSEDGMVRISQLGRTIRIERIK